MKELKNQIQKELNILQDMIKEEENKEKIEEERKKLDMLLKEYLKDMY